MKNKKVSVKVLNKEEDKHKVYLVTGSTGFIGFSVARRLLLEGNVVVGIDNNNDYYDEKLKEKRNLILKAYKSYVFYETNLTDIDSISNIFNKHKFDSVIHLGAQAGVRYSMENPHSYAQSNYIGSLNILENCKKYKIENIILASTSSVYGASNPPFIEDETSADLPMSIYSATKRGVELLAHTYHHLYNMNIVNLRFFTVYGPWSRPDMAMLKFAKLMMRDEEITLYGNGEMQRSYTFIDDIVNGVIAATTLSGFETINLGGGETYTTKYLVELLEKYLFKKAKIKFDKIQAGDVKDTIASQTKAKKVLNYEPKTNFEEGIRLFCNWYLDNQEFLQSLKKAKQ